MNYELLWKRKNIELDAASFGSRRVTGWVWSRRSKKYKSTKLCQRVTELSEERASDTNWAHFQRYVLNKV